MRIALLILCAVIVMAIIAYWISFPRNSHYIFSGPAGGSMTFSRTVVSFQSAPDHYASNGFDHFEPYISKLLATTTATGSSIYSCRTASAASIFLRETVPSKHF